ncbi:MAG TPA: DNA replication and repair protein RecF, partial [Pseudomonadota bacterium]|nr:DNA replication and repair protein RecF [Pseudomonadota bacterium]
NVIFGDNGQGKTNLLEAIFLVATQRAFRSSKLDEICRFGTGKAEVIAAVSHADVERRLAIQLFTKPSRKVALVDGKSARSSDYFTGVHVVLFAPEDLLLPKGPPEDRRRFLDRAIWNTCPNYLDEVRVYEQVLKSRNAVLRSMLLQTGRPHRSDSFGDAGMQISSGGDSDAMLAVYTEQLAQAGARIIERRRHYVRTIAPQVEATFERISRSGLAANVSYRPKLSAHLQDRAVDSAETPELCEILHEQFERDTRRDRLRGFTHSGPHGDDMLVSLDGREAALHASQGQVRALVLALKITEIQHLFFLHGDPPVLLLDDVSSELDAQRNGYLFDFLRAMPSQVFITTTSPEYVKLSQDRLDVRMQMGALQTNLQS